MKKGFTLIELLIVISIIGILAVALLPNILSAPATARDAGRKAALNNVLAALEQYKAANGEYPGTGGTAMELSTAGVADFFKGGAVPTGADQNSGAEEVPLGFSVANGTADAPVVYCPFDSIVGTTGYSYAVAIRMEQPLNGDNALITDVDCSAATVATVTGGTNSNWYVLVQ